MPLIIIFPIWIIVSIVIGKLGENTKLGSFGTFLVSFFFSPVVGVIVLWVAERKPRRPPC